MEHKILFCFFIIFFTIVIIFIIYYMISKNYIYNILTNMIGYNSQCLVTFTNEDYLNIIKDIYDIKLEYKKEFNINIIIYLIKLLVSVTINKKLSNHLFLQFKKFKFNNNELIYVLIDYNYNAIILCKSTTTDYEIIEELKVYQTDYYGLKVHTGFKNMLINFDYEIINFINNKNIKNIYGIGHSLGGALLNILTWRLKDLNKNLYIISIGAPRCADFKLDFNITSNIYYVEIINDMDIVPILIPPIINYNNKYYFYNKLSTILKSDIIILNFNYNCILSNHLLPGYYNNLKLLY